MSGKFAQKLWLHAPTILWALAIGAAFAVIALVIYFPDLIHVSGGAYLRLP